MRRLFKNRMRLMTAVSVLFVAVALVETRAGQAYCKSNFRKYFEGLSVAEANVNPVERFIFSLLLSKTNPPSHPVPRQDARQDKQL
jgi:hypothetical protein